MKALSLTQPWASLVALGAKRIETRSWSTPYRGPIAIHAAKGWPVDCQELIYSEPFKSALKTLSGQPIPRGAVLCTVELEAVIPTEMFVVTDDGDLLRQRPRNGAMNWISDQEWAFGDYSVGRFAWVLRVLDVLHEPAPYRGSLGLWEWPDGAVAS